MEYAENINIKIKDMPLIKFKSADKIESLRKGHLYAKSLKYYRDLEMGNVDNEMGDAFEAMLHINEGYLKNYRTEEVIPLSDVLIETASSNAFVFCMFCIYPSSKEFSFTNNQKEKLISFGDTALIVHDCRKFIHRVCIAAEHEGYEAHFGVVQYFKPTDDIANLFFDLSKAMWRIALWKRDKYAYQQEFRIIFTLGNGGDYAKEDHLALNIGDISDITTVLPSKDVLLTTMVEKE